MARRLLNTYPAILKRGGMAVQNRSGRRPTTPPPRPGEAGTDILGWTVLAGIVGLYLGLDWLTRR